MASERHRNCVLGIPPPPFTWKKGKTDDDDPDAPDPDQDAVAERFSRPNFSNNSPAKTLGPCVVDNCEHRRMGEMGPGRMHCLGHQAFARPEPFSGLTARAEARDPTPFPSDDENEPESPIARAACERRKARVRNG